MTAEVKVTSAKLELVTVKLSKALLKQCLRLDYNNDLTERTQEAIDKLVIGWFHGSVLGDEFTKYLLIQLPSGDLRIADGGLHPNRKYKQLYF